MMRRARPWWVPAAVVVLWSWCASAQAWEIQRFSAVLEVLPDGHLQVTEIIDADFGQEQLHGLYRDIPVEYRDRFNHRLTLRWRVREVTDAQHRPQPVRVMRSGPSVRVRIGDAAATVSGLHTYIIHYDVARALTRFPDHDELYWNVTGNEWAVPIREAHALVILPEAVDPRFIRDAAYSGPFGSRATEAPATRRGRELQFSAAQPLGISEGLTIVVGWPPGSVARPSWWQALGWWLADNWGYGLPLATLLLMLLWWQHAGREFPGRGSLAVEYGPPEGLRPAAIGALVDDRIDLRDLTATVIDLAVRGYLTIVPVGKTLFGHPKDHRFVVRKPFLRDPALSDYERRMLKALFGSRDEPGEERLLSSLEMRFSDELPGLRTALYTELIAGGYLESDPEALRARFLVAGGLIAVLGIWLAATQLAAGSAALSIGIGAALSGIIVALIGRIMPRKTRKGRAALDRIRGLAEFLSRTDRDRIARLTAEGATGVLANQPDLLASATTAAVARESQDLFERLLPYAMALGVANRWASAFEGLYATPPSWYAGEWSSDWSPRAFTNQLGQTTQAMGATFVSTPRTDASSGSSGFGGGGGGSSGGGFGGGGGGGW